MVIEFVKNLEQGSIEAHFIENSNIIETKVLTQIEEDGLSEIVDYSKLPQHFSIDYIMQELDSLYFDNEGQETNFELIVKSFS